LHTGRIFRRINFVQIEGKVETRKLGFNVVKPAGKNADASI
jgi:hypothetical protein